MNVSATWIVHTGHCINRVGALLILMTGMACSVGNVQARIFGGFTLYGKVVDYECNGIDEVDKFGFQVDWDIPTILYGIVYYFSDRAKTYPDGTFRVAVKRRNRIALRISNDTLDRYHLVGRPSPIAGVYRQESGFRDYLLSKMNRKNPVLYYAEKISSARRDTRRIHQRAELLEEPSIINSPYNDSSWSGLSYRIKESLDGNHHWTLGLSVDKDEEGGLIEIESGVSSYSGKLPTTGYARQVTIDLDRAFDELDTVRKEYYFKRAGGQNYGLMVIEFSLNTPDGPAFNIYYDYISSATYKGIVKRPRLPKYSCGGALSVAPDGYYSNFPEYKQDSLRPDPGSYAKSLAEKAMPRYIMRSRIEENLTKELFDQVMAMRPTIPREYCRSIILRSNVTSEMLDELLKISAPDKNKPVGCSKDIELVTKNVKLSPATQKRLLKRALERNRATYSTVKWLAENPALTNELQNKMLKLHWTVVRRLAKNTGLDKDVQLKMAKRLNPPDPSFEPLISNAGLVEEAQLEIVEHIRGYPDKLMLLMENPAVTTETLDYIYEVVRANTRHEQKEFDVLDYIVAHPNVSEKTLRKLSNNEDGIISAAAKTRLDHGIVLYPAGYPELTAQQIKQRELLARRLTEKGVAERDRKLAERDRKLKERIEKNRTANIIVNKPDGIAPLLTGLSYGDNDADGIPDYADFKSTIHFRPLILRVPDKFKVKHTTLKVKYSASPPLGLKRLEGTDSEHDYYMPPGTARIWTKKPSQQRDPRPVDKGGDFVDSDSAYPLELFTINNTKKGRIFTLYIERVRGGDGFIDVEMEGQ